MARRRALEIVQEEFHPALGRASDKPLGGERRRVKAGLVVAARWAASGGPCGMQARGMERRRWRKLASHGTCNCLETKKEAYQKGKFKGEQETMKREPKTRKCRQAQRKAECPVCHMELGERK